MMNYLKSIWLVSMLVTLWVPELLAKEISVEQFANEFYSALQTNNAYKIWQLSIDNPNTAEQFQQLLTRHAGESTEEMAEQLHALADLLGKSLAYSELDRLNEEGKKSFDTDYSTTSEKWQAGLAKARELGDKDYISQFLGNIGTVYERLGQYQKALDYYQQALEIQQKIADLRGVGKNFTNIGNVYNQLGQYKKTLEYYQQALEIQRKIDDWREVGNNLTNMGVVYQNLGQYQKALDYYQQALEIHHRLSERGKGNALSNMGVAYQNLGQYQKALDYYQQALESHRKISDRRGEGNDLGNMGVAYQNLGQYKKTLDYYQQALNITREIGDRRGEGSHLANFGVVHQNLGQYQTALDYYQQALDIAREIGDRRGIGNNLTNVGVVYRNLGQYQTALNYYQQALDITHDIGDRRGIGNNLTNIGSVYYQLGQHKKALDYYQQALEIHQKIDYQRGEGSDLNNIGNVYYQLGQYQTALDYYQKALTLNRKIGEQRETGFNLTNIGNAYYQLGQHQKSLGHNQQALEIFRELGNQVRTGIILNNIGIMSAKLGDYQKAKVVLQKAIMLIEKLGSDNLWKAQYGLAFVEANLQQFDSAIVYYEQSIDSIEKTRTGLPEKTQKLSFMRDKIGVYDEFVTLLKILQKLYPEKGYDHKALKIFERKQARIFLKEMGQSGARLFAGLAQQKSQQEFSLQTQLNQINQALADERSKPVAGLEGEVVQNQERINNLEQHERKLQTELEVLQEDIKTNHPDYYALKYPKPVNLDTLQTEVLQPNELMLIYGVMEDSTTLWVIGKETFQLFDLPLTEAILTEKVKYIRRGIENQLDTLPNKNKKKQGLRRIYKNPPKTLSDLTYELYTLLVPEQVRPLLKQAKTGTLYIVPTGALYALPFEMLITQQVKQATDTLHYLIEEVPIAYLSSASLLKILRDAKKRRQKAAPYPLLAFANPVYDSTSTLTNDNINRHSITALRSETYRAIRVIHFTPLPETEDEAKAVATFFKAPDDSNPLQLHEAASCDTVNQWNQTTRLDDYQFVVFATHGILPNEVDYITQPALVLSHPDTENTKDIEDIERCSHGYLKMRDVFALQLNAKLVSLSACNTGQGRLERGEGIMGLTRAFMYAGTPAVAVTLWAVESFSAKTLNVGFFQHLKYMNKPAAALRAMKLRMLQGKEGNKYKHPYYWAPFVMFGEEPFEQQTQVQTELEYHLQALAMYREIGDKSGEAKSLSRLGNVYFDNKQYQQALDSFQQALAMHRELDDKRGIMDNLFQMGDIYFELEQYQKGRKYYQQAKILR